MHRIFKKMFFKIALVLVGLITLLVVGFSLAFDATYVMRVITYPYGKSITNSEWYTPKEVIKGTSSPMPWETQQPDAASLTAIATARDYAATRSSASFMIIQDGKILAEEYFGSTKQNSTLNSMSMAKSIASMLVGIAIDEKKLPSENVLLKDYLPEWSNPNKDKITFKHLLQMNSGLIVSDNQSNILSDIVKMHLLADIKPLALTVGSQRPPGEAYSYNNFNTEIIALALENIYGMRYAQLASEKIWSKLGVSDSAIWLDKKEGEAKAYCCMFSSARDWARVGQMIAHNGVAITGIRIVSSAWIERMTLPSAFNPTYGYSIRTNTGFDDIDSLTRAIRLEGQDYQLVYMFPELDLLMVRMGENPPNWNHRDFVKPVLTEFYKRHRVAKNH